MPAKTPYETYKNQNLGYSWLTLLQIADNHRVVFVDETCFQSTSLKNTALGVKDLDVYQQSTAHYYALNLLCAVYNGKVIACIKEEEIQHFEFRNIYTNALQTPERDEDRLQEEDLHSDGQLTDS